MKRVLIFTYYWPPAGGPGVQRFLKFARYLREFGWEPVVVSPKEGSWPYRDDSLLEDVPDGMQVIHTGTREPFALYNKLSGKKGKEVSVAMIGYKESKSPVQSFAKWVRANFFIPDARVGWKPYAVKAGLRYIKSTGADAIITTGPPHSAHLVGLEIQRKTGLPWLADFRDPWTTVYYNAFFKRGPRAMKKDQKLEDSVLQKADHTVVISHGMQDEFADRAKASSVIPNGYDEADMYRGEAIQDEFFRLCYIGNMKPNQHVPALWNAAAELVKSNEEFARDFRFHFTGSLDPSIPAALQNLGISDSLISDGFVSHQEATRRMFQAGMLLFIIPDSADNHRIVTGKIFEYIASGTRIFPIGPVSGDASRILSGVGGGQMMDYQDETAMKNQLLASWQEWKSGDRYPLKATSKDYMQYSRRALTGKLAGLLDNITA